MFDEDELPGFEKTSLELSPEDDGPLAATLVRTKHVGDDSRPAVLYLHGFSDYFFQTHVADAFEAAGYRFYALELRRYGRSIRPGNRPCMAWDVSDYFPEIDWAFEMIRASHPRVSSFVTHSTGSLIAASYLAARHPQRLVSSLVANSPFLRFNLSQTKRALSVVVARLSPLRPQFLVPARLEGIYDRTLHTSESGSWTYDLNKKPIGGFPVHAGWFGMIRGAQRRVRRGLGLELPILVLHSDRSRRSTTGPSPEDFEADLVLDVEDMKRLGPRLGSRVTTREIPEGLHDLTLSKKSARDAAVEAMISFVREHDA